jgi:hypothetical protein
MLTVGELLTIGAITLLGKRLGTSVREDFVSFLKRCENDRPF